MAFFKNKFDSIKQDWNTPKDLFNKLNQEFQFETDLAADSSNALCKNFFTKENNGLDKKWSGVCWCNPPYGDKDSKMVDWIKKADLEAKNNKDLTIIMLIPARTNTKWFHNYCMKAKEVRFICGRPKFSGQKHGLPQPLCLVIFARKKDEEKTQFSSYYL